MRFRSNGKQKRWGECDPCRLSSKREERERQAAAEGRELEKYASRPVREFRAALLKAEDQADSIRRKFVSDWLRPFRLTDTEIYRVDPEHRDRVKARYRQRYGRHLDAQRAKVAEYKLAHPERVQGWHETRRLRVVMTDDGTLPLDELHRMKREATHCAYCGTTFYRDSDVQTDHMVALCHGGEHAKRNVVIVCRSCNARKASLTYHEWVERVAPENRERVEALWAERYGDALTNLKVLSRAKSPAGDPIANRA